MAVSAFRPHHNRSRVVAAIASAGLIASMITVTATSANAAPVVTLTPNPAQASEAFEGWGTSLVWFANATGDYPEALREELYQAVFGEDGLNLNIARYNVGGGHASDVTDYLRPGGAVDGYWAADATGSLYGTTTNYADRETLLETWDPDNPAHYDWTADETQRWWVERLVADDQISQWEVFANSPPFFMTESGYVSGGFNASHEQIKPAAYDKFVSYLTAVTENLEKTYGIDVATIDPFNEPNTSYWGTTLNWSGQPDGGRQEGAHVGSWVQQDVIDALDTRLQRVGTSTEAVISAMDETNPGKFAANWNDYSAEVKAKVAQMNVHTYGTGDRLLVRDQAKTADKPVWMSEIEGSWVDGYNPVDMRNGLGIAERVMSDLRELEPSAWVLWQPVEDQFNMEPAGENLNWGSIFVDFDCRNYNEGGTQVFKSERRVDAAWGDSTGVPECLIETGSKYNTLRNFTHFIGKGDYLIPVNDTMTTAATKADGSGVTFVHSNETTEEQRVVVDLSNFGKVTAGARLTPYVTTESTLEDSELNALVQGADVAVDADSMTATVTIPGQSVATFVVDGVSGVADSAPAFKDGERYQIVGAQSGKALTSATGATATTITTLASDPVKVANQTWTVHEVPAGSRAAVKSYVLANSDGKVLGATFAGTDLRDMSVAEAKTTAATRWILNTTDGATFSFVNTALTQAIEVGEQSSAENAPVGVYGSNGGPNQAWHLRSVTATGVEDVNLWTRVGIAPVLPVTVTPTYAWGKGTPIDVVWNAISNADWQIAGQFTVAGTATDMYGNELAVRAIVDVGDLTVTDSVSLTTYAGASKDAVRAAAPATVPAHVGASGAVVDTPVVWDWDAVAADAFATAGMVKVHGQAESGAQGASIAATLNVIVTNAVPTNIAPLDSTSASATFTEGSHGVDRTRNRVITDKGWSNWKSGTKNTSDTLTYTFDESNGLEEAKVYFYRDGSDSWAETIRFEYRDAAGNWVSVPGYESPVAVVSPADGTAPIVTVNLGGVDATGLRVELGAYPDAHMTVSEVEIYASKADVASSATLSALRVDGELVAGFAPEVSDYSVTTSGARYPTVSAVPSDQNAKVKVTQPNEATAGVATIRVTAADGVGEQVYSVTVARSVDLQSVALSGEAKVGATVQASVSTDPAGASIAYQWLIDGAAIVGADGSSYTPVATDVGSRLSVTAIGSAVGFTDSDAVTSDSVTVLAEDDPGAAVDPKVTLSAASATAGGTIEITASGYGAGAALEVVLHSDPVTLGTLTADASGAGALTATIPAATVAGEHTVVVTDTVTGASSSAKLTVLAAPTVPVEPGPSVGPGATAVPGVTVPGADAETGLPITGGVVIPIIALGLALLGGGTYALRGLRARQDER